MKSGKLKMRLVTVKKFSRVDESSATMSNAAAAEVIDAHLAALEGEPRPLVPVDAARRPQIASGDGRCHRLRVREPGLSGRLCTNARPKLTRGAYRPFSRRWRCVRLASQLTGQFRFSRQCAPAFVKRFRI